MTKFYQIEITFSAEQDLEEIYRYITMQILERQHAKTQCEAFEKAILSLATLPERHSLLQQEELAGLGIRNIPCDNYLIFYKIVDTTVFILRVLYKKRNWTYLL